jgi:tetratricopeptide (TPR) repeat protein
MEEVILSSSSRESYRVTAVVSAYKAARFMHGRLQNLCEQSLCVRGELEIIIIDSASPEDERGIAQDFMRQCPHIGYVRTSQRESVYAAWNRGIKHAKGSYFINANCDDRFHPAALDGLVEHLDIHTNLDAVYGDWLCTNTANDTFDSPGPKAVLQYPEYHPPLLFYGQVSSHAAMIRRAAFERIGPYDPRLEVYGDREFMFRLASTGGTVARLPMLTGLYYENPQSVQRRDPQAAHNENREVTARYFSRDRFVRLCFASGTAPSDADIAQAYADTGALGKDPAVYDGVPQRAPDMAAHFYTEALRYDERNVTALNNLAIVKHLAGNGAEARDLLKKAGSLASDLLKPLVQWNLRIFDGAHGSFGWLSTGMPPGRFVFYQADKPEEVFAQARYALEEGRYEEALKAFSGLLASNPKAIHVHANLGFIYYRLRRFGEAMRHFSRSLAVQPDNRFTVYHCGAMLKEIGDAELSAKLLGAYVRKHGDDWEIAGLL